MSRATAIMLAVAVVTTMPVRAETPATPERAIPRAELRSGSTFQSPATRAEQDDLTTNPGMLWADQGVKLWSETAGAAGKSCASCHGVIAGMKGVATRYPLVDARTGEPMTLAGRIRECRVERQNAADLQPESEALLALTTAVTHQSRGQPLAVSIAGAAAAHFAAGRALYHQRQGQLNLSCANCHDQNWGKRARNETISQGHPNGFATYRLEWQTLGSLERRLKACFLGVRAEPLAPDSLELRQLELYLAWRAEGLPIEAPAIRR